MLSISPHRCLILVKESRIGRSAPPAELIHRSRAVGGEHRTPQVIERHPINRTDGRSANPPLQGRYSPLARATSGRRMVV